MREARSSGGRDGEWGLLPTPTRRTASLDRPPIRALDWLPKPLSVVGREPSPVPLEGDPVTFDADPLPLKGCRGLDGG
jgi:hypothetical protein